MNGAFLRKKRLFLYVILLACIAGVTAQNTSIIPTTLELVVDPAEAVLGESVLATITLTDEQSNPLVGQAVEISLDSVLQSVKVTDGQGQVLYLWDTSSSQIGTHLISASFIGSETYQQSVASQEVQITFLELSIPQENSTSVEENVTEPQTQNATIPEENATAENVAEPEPIVQPIVTQGEAPTLQFTTEGIITWKKELVGYEPVYVTKEIVDPCRPGNSTCEETITVKQVIDSNQRGNPIYEKKEIVSYNISGKIIPHLQEHVGCFICPTDHDIQVCYAYDDGFSENIADQWKCECKKGTSCKQSHPITEKVLFARTDGELI